MSENLQSDADNFDHGTREEAAAFLARYLPVAVAANPRYRSDDGAETQWLTNEIRFAGGAGGSGISVSMSETFLEFRNGAQSATASHDVQFSIDDVRISELPESNDVTVTGEKVRGVLFTCLSGKCIASKWNGAPSQKDMADISLQDATARASVLKAFEALKRAPGGAG